MADTKRGRERKGADKARQRTRHLIEAELDAADRAPPLEDEDVVVVVDADDGRGDEGPRLSDVAEFDERLLAAPDIGERADGDD